MFDLLSYSAPRSARRLPPLPWLISAAESPRLPVVQPALAAHQILQTGSKHRDCSSAAHLTESFVLPAPLSKSFFLNFFHNACTYSQHSNVHRFLRTLGRHDADAIPSASAQPYIQITASDIRQPQLRIERAISKNCPRPVFHVRRAPPKFPSPSTSRTYVGNRYG